MERDREAIDKVVIICAIDPVDRTRQSPPYLEFKFDIFNDSLYQISIDDALAGHITFRKGNQEHKLTEYREIKNNEARNVSTRAVGRFTVYQRLSTVEAESLTKTDDVWFDFTNLEINVIATDPISKVVPRRLDTTMKLTSKTVRYLFNDERAALGQKTINASSSKIRTEQPEKLQAEIESLKAELAKLNGLAFEVDTNVQSDASLRAHRDVAASLRQTQNRLTEVDKYLLTLQFKVQFENHDTHTRALKRMELSLIESLNGNDNRIPFLDEPDMLQMKTDSPERDKLTRFDSTEFLLSESKRFGCIS